MQQLRDFPSAGHDDGPDALSQACEWLAVALRQNPQGVRWTL
jgi:hypothetical protein